MQHKESKEKYILLVIIYIMGMRESEKMIEKKFLLT